MEAGSGINIRHDWTERESQFQALCWQKLNHSSLPVSCVRQHYQNPPTALPKLFFCDPGDEDLIKLSLMLHFFAQRVCSASAKYYSSNSQKFSSPLLGLMGPADLPPHLSTITLLLLQGQRLLEMVGDSEPGHSSKLPGLRPKKSPEDKGKLAWISAAPS